MINLRRFSQLFFLGLFFYLLYKTALGQESSLPKNLFFYFSPLFALSSWSAWFIAALVILLLSLFLGRFFCSWVCPLGSCIDIGERLLGFGFKKARRGQQWIFPGNFRFYLLAVILLGLLFKLDLAFPFQPAAILYKASAFLVFPQSLPLFNRLFFFLIFLMVILLNLLERRFYCQKICPEGAVYSLFSYFSPLKARLQKNCTACGICEKVCKGGRKNTECLRCLSCLSVCPVKGTNFELEFIPAKKEFSLSRRGFLYAGAAGLLAVGGLKFLPAQPEILPPNARPLEEFNRHCLRCGACMKVCPTGVLQPNFSDLTLLFTPMLVQEIGYCEQMCNLCGQVCPTSAIKPFRAEDKARIFIGKAELFPQNCLVYQGKDCFICYEHCSYLAIRRVKKQPGWPVPEVIKEKCVGCGICENKCPVRPKRAIVVYPL